MRIVDIKNAVPVTCTGIEVEPANANIKKSGIIGFTNSEIISYEKFAAWARRDMIENTFLKENLNSVSESDRSVLRQRGSIERTSGTAAKASSRIRLSEAFKKSAAILTAMYESAFEISIYELNDPGR